MLATDYGNGAAMQLAIITGSLRREKLRGRRKKRLGAHPQGGRFAPSPPPFQPRGYGRGAQMQLVILTGTQGSGIPAAGGKMRSPLTCARWRND